MLRQQLEQDMKQALRGGAKKQLATIRLIWSQLRKHEIDNKIASISDQELTTMLQKMVKQRKDSIAQFTKANRLDLVEVEQFELDVIKGYLPKPLSTEELTTIIHQVIDAVQPKSMADFGRVMAQAKSQLQGRADLSEVVPLIKQLVTKAVS